MTTAGAIWVLLNDPDESILINSQHLDLATRITATIRNVFRYNRLFRLCYPEWCPPAGTERGWESQSQMTVCNRVLDRKEPSIMAGSFEAPRTGDHFGRIFNDDPHNEKNIGTIDQIQKVKDGWEAQEPLGDGERTKRIYVATRWSFADLNDEMMQKMAPLFYKKFIEKTLLYNQPLANIEKDDELAVFLLSVWKDETRTAVIWPEKRSYESLMKWKARVGSYFWSCQMENDPIPDEERTFHPRNFRYYNVETELNDKGVPTKYYVCGEEKIGDDVDTGRPIMKLRKIPVNETTNFMTVDPAYGNKPHNDYVGIVVCAHWTEPKSRLRWLIVLQTVRQKMTTAQSKRKIEELYVKWGCRKVGIESHVAGTIYLENLESDPRWGGELNIEIVRIKRGTGESKGMRVTRLEPYYETYRVWHAQKMRSGVLEQELLGFVGGVSRGSSDDVADAMSDHVDFEHTMKMPGFDPMGMVDLPRMMEEEDWDDWSRDNKDWLRV